MKKKANTSSEWIKFKSTFSKKWHFDPLKKTSDLRIIGNIQTDFSDILKKIKSSKSKKNKNFFVSNRKSNDKAFIKRNNDLIKIGYKKNTNEFYQIFSYQYPELFQKFIDFTGLENGVSSIILQPPGNILGWHQDAFVQFRKKYPKKSKNNRVIRYMVLMEDWDWGHSFTAGNSTITQWKQGDVVFWEPYMFHCGANAGMQDKITLNVTGFETSKSLHLNKKKKIIKI